MISDNVEMFMKSCIDELEMHSVTSNFHDISMLYLKYPWYKNLFKKLIANNLRSPTDQLLDMANVLLRFAWNISDPAHKELSRLELMDGVCEMVLKSSTYSNATALCIPEQPPNPCSKWYFLKGRQIMSRLNKHDWINYCIGIKICKRLFKAAFETRDTFWNSICRKSLVYLAALYLICQNKEKCLKHGKMALMNIRQVENQSIELHTLHCVDLMFLDVYARLCGIQLLHMYALRNSTISQQFTLQPESHTRVSVRFAAHHILTMASHT